MYIVSQNNNLLNSAASHFGSNNADVGMWLDQTKVFMNVHFQSFSNDYDFQEVFIFLQGEESVIFQRKIFWLNVANVAEHCLWINSMVFIQHLNVAVWDVFKMKKEFFFTGPFHTELINRWIIFMA